MDQPAPFSQPQHSGWNGYVIAIIICIVVGALYYFLSPYYQSMLDYIETMKTISEMLFTLANAFYPSDEQTQPEEKPPKEKTPPKETTTSSQPKEKTPKTTTSSQPKEKTQPKEKPPTPTPKPDDSTSSIQGVGTAGYCYVGEWKGIRSCVKVDKTTPCKTNVYSTEELCVNPTLRP